MSLNFKGTGEFGYGGYSLTDQLLYNLKAWIDNGLAVNGAYNVFKLNQDSFLANDEAILRPIFDERYGDRYTYNGVGREWIFESGIQPINSGIVPFRPSGVYVNGVFVPSSDMGPHRHHFDFLHGRVIFEEAQNINDVIATEYCSRSVFVGNADTEDFQTLMFASINEFLTNTTPSGTASREHQALLPAIFIDIDSETGRGLELGGGQIKTRIVTLHIFADNSSDRNILMDWLGMQNRSAFIMFDLNKITFPFDQYGDIVSGVTNWIDLMSTYPWKKLRILDGTSKKINSLNTQLFRAQVRWTCEIDIGGI